MDRMRTYKVEGMVIKHRDWGEADRIITVYTRETGKLRVIAKGAKKIHSRKAGHLEPFTHVVIQLDRSSDMPIISQVETIDPYFTLRDDLTTLSLGLFILELMDRFTKEEEGEDIPLFNLLRDSIKRLEQDADKWLVVATFEMKLLDSLGFRPQFFQCVNCNKPVQPVDQFFSPMEGGVICPDCANKKMGLWPIAVEPLRFFRHFQRSNYADSIKANVTLEIRKQMDVLIQDYLSFLLEKNLNTPRFINSVNS